MGKRSNYARRDSDYYPTPQAPVTKIVQYLWKCNKFCEPCAGNGQLAIHLVNQGFTLGNWSDKEPQFTQDRFSPIPELDLFDLKPEHVANSDIIITNPPWPHPGQRGNPTIEMILHMTDLLPTWVLLNADFMQNIYFSRVAKHCKKIVAVGRVSWQENGKSGLENSAWYLFDKNYEGDTVFHDRTGQK